MESKIFQWMLALSTLVTACSGERVATGSYDVSSNCPGATQNGTLDLKQSTTFSTSSYDYDATGSSAFGFPNDKWNRDGTSLTSTGTERNCTALVVGEKVSQAAFICRTTATNDAVCSIVVKGK